VRVQCTVVQSIVLRHYTALCYYLQRRSEDVEDTCIVLCYYLQRRSEDVEDICIVLCYYLQRRSEDVEDLVPDLLRA
jgi:hypothetical protein